MCDTNRNQAFQYVIQSIISVRRRFISLTLIHLCSRPMITTPPHTPSSQPFPPPRSSVYLPAPELGIGQGAMAKLKMTGIMRLRPPTFTGKWTLGLTCTAMSGVGDLTEGAPPGTWIAWQSSCRSLDVWSAEATYGGLHMTIPSHASEPRLSSAPAIFMHTVPARQRGVGAILYLFALISLSYSLLGFSLPLLISIPGYLF